MRKIPTMFERDESLRGHPVRDALKSECAWVLGEGVVATRKLDGTNVKIEGGKLYKRQKSKQGDYDEASYVACERGRPDEAYLWGAFDGRDVANLPDGIYEAIGPQIQGNPEGVATHLLVRVLPTNPDLEILYCPRTFEGLRDYLNRHVIEGVVFHGPEGKLCKIKRRDFGLPWPFKEND